MDGCIITKTTIQFATKTMKVNMKSAHTCGRRKEVGTCERLKNFVDTSKPIESNGDTVAYLISNTNGNGLGAAFATLDFFVCVRHDCSSIAGCVGRDEAMNETYVAARFREEEEVKQSIMMFCPLLRTVLYTIVPDCGVFVFLPCVVRAGQTFWRPFHLHGKIDSRL